MWETWTIWQGTFKQDWTCSCSDPLWSTRVVGTLYYQHTPIFTSCTTDGKHPNFMCSCAVGSILLTGYLSTGFILYIRGNSMKYHCGWHSAFEPSMKFNMSWAMNIAYLSEGGAILLTGYLRTRFSFGIKGDFTKCYCGCLGIFCICQERIIFWCQWHVLSEGPEKSPGWTYIHPPPLRFFTQARPLTPGYHA